MGHRPRVLRVLRGVLRRVRVGLFHRHAGLSDFAGVLRADRLAEAAADVLAVHARVQRGVPDRGLRGVHPVHEAVRGLGFMRDGSGADVGLPRNRRRKIVFTFVPLGVSGVPVHAAAQVQAAATRRRQRGRGSARVQGSRSPIDRVRGLLGPFERRRVEPLFPRKPRAGKSRRLARASDRRRRGSHRPNPLSRRRAGPVLRRGVHPPPRAERVLRQPELRIRRGVDGG